MEMWEHPGARVDQLFISASRRDVEDQEIGPALTTLGKMLKPEVARRVRGKVVFCIDGYDDDPRDLYHISEVRSWMAALDREFPFWFYFLDIGPASTLTFVMFSLCQFERVPGGSLIPPAELERFVDEHIQAMNTLAVRLGDPQHVTEARLRIIDEFFVSDED